MIELGRVCVKTAGRDAGKKGAVIDLINDNYAVIDGDLRRKKCNIRHLEPLDISIKINRNATHEEVKSELAKHGIIVK
ncbi:50S ribosomal protein L14e [Candidatus Woesearchaeota archaeon]|nr:50S ribosomal protein L14e [Candidatus Woesearchaeota archaeon]